MLSHPFIKLIVGQKLEKSDVKLWLDTALSALPDGVHSEAQIKVKGQLKTVPSYHKKENDSYSYIIPLIRNPSLSEVQKVAVLWHKTFPEGDFEIDYSANDSSFAAYSEVSESALKELALEASKRCHSSWLNEMSEKGWSYGRSFSQRNKKNPKLLPWEQLSNTYKSQDLKRFQHILEVLNSMNLKISRK